MSLAESTDDAIINQEEQVHDKRIIKEEAKNPWLGAGGLGEMGQDGERED